MSDLRDGLPPQLFALAERAAPARVDEAHLTAEAIDRARSGDDAPDLDPVYRHLSVCPLCRAQLIEPYRAPTSLAPESALGPPSRSKRPLRLRSWAALAAAALLPLAAGYAWLREPRPRELSISQRPYWGMMGPSSAAGGDAADANLELTISPPAPAAAFLIPCSSATCGPLSQPRWFARRETGAFTLEIAPRSLRVPGGATLGLVVWGEQLAVEQAAGELQRRSASTQADAASEAEIAAIAEQHSARIQKIHLER